MTEERNHDMTDHSVVAAGYIAAFNETDPAARQVRIRETFTPDARYTDPLSSGAGHEEIDQLIAGVQQQFPGWVFRVVDAVDGHGVLIRFGWSLGPADAVAADAPVLGFDVVELAADGRIRAVHGFLDRVPAAA